MAVIGRFPTLPFFPAERTSTTFATSMSSKQRLWGIKLHSNGAAITIQQSDFYVMHAGNSRSIFCARGGLHKAVGVGIALNRADGGIMLRLLLLKLAAVNPNGAKSQSPAAATCQPFSFSWYQTLRSG